MSSSVSVETSMADKHATFLAVICYETGRACTFLTHAPEACTGLGKPVAVGLLCAARELERNAPLGIAAAEPPLPPSCMSGVCI